MAKLQENPLLPSGNDPAVMLAQLQKQFRQVSQQVNALSEGRATAAYNASTVAPPDGTGNPGDFVAKIGQTVSGPVGDQYVVTGWRCVDTGTSTQWVEVLETVRVTVHSTPAPTPAPTSAPSPAPATPYSQKIQAENATLHNIGVVTVMPGYEGTGHADWFRSGYDEYLEFSFTGVPTGGASGNLTLSYAGYGTGDQTVTIYVNGDAGTMYHFPGTSSTWTQKVVPVSFVAGTNTVRLTPEWSGYTYFDWAQFDQLSSAPAPAPSPSPSPSPPPPPPPPAPAPAPGSPPYVPFGSRPDGAYPYGIVPTGYTNTQLDTAVKDCYDKWKFARLAKSPTFTATSGIFAGQTISDGYHVSWGSSDIACVSEGQGYGMLITVHMAGYDANAKTFFDGLYRVARGRPAYGMPSTANANVYLMEWRLLPGMVSGGDGYNANDGDEDIAYALLLAHRQWGSSGSINYFQEAINTINAMKAVNFASNGVQRGPQNVSRVSDYMIGHFRAFKAATGDTFWDDARTNSLSLAQTVTNNYSASAKLQPGFVYDPLGSNPRPDTIARVDRSGIEDIYDQNSVRNPWRWATDYVRSGDATVKSLVNGIVGTLKSSSGGSANSLSYAYRLDGTPVSGLYHDGSQAGCLMAGCMVDSAHQTFLNALYASNIGSGYDTRYFYAELILIPLILVSGNWMKPA